MPPAAVPRGPVVLRPGSSPARRRRRRLFLGIWLAVFAGLLWPIHSVVAARALPLVLGLPFSFFWVVALLLVQFAALLWLFLGEETEDRGPASDEGGGD